MTRQLEEKKFLISKLTQDLSKLEIQAKNEDDNQVKLNKRIVELNEKCLKLKK